MAPRSSHQSGGISDAAAGAQPCVDFRGCDSGCLVHCCSWSRNQVPYILNASFLETLPPKLTLDISVALSEGVEISAMALSVGLQTA